MTTWLGHIKKEARDNGETLNDAKAVLIMYDGGPEDVV